MDMTAELTKRTEQIENIIKKYLPEEEGYLKQRICYFHIFQIFLII